MRGCGYLGIRTHATPGQRGLDKDGSGNEGCSSGRRRGQAAWRAVLRQMRAIIACLMVVTVVVGASAPASVSAGSAGRVMVLGPYRAGVLLVGFRPGVGVAQRVAIERAAGAAHVRALARLQTDVVRVAPSRVARVAGLLRGDRWVQRVERDPVAQLEHASCVNNSACVIPNDPLSFASGICKATRRCIPPTVNRQPGRRHRRAARVEHHSR